MAGRGSTWVAGALSACLLLAGCGGGGRPSSSAGRGSTITSPASAYPVDTAVETFVDTARPTPEHGTIPSLPARTLRTDIFYPELPAATPLARPLIVFAHGSGGLVPGYLPLLQSWAAAGYVVAAPELPVAAEQPDGAAGDSSSIEDLANQPADLSFVISSVLRLNGDASSELHGRVDPSRIGAAGQSLGAFATLALAGNTCCYDSRVKAAALLAGLETQFGSGTFWTRIRTPTLFVHGDADASVPYRDGRKAYGDAPPPRFLLTLLGGSHTDMYDPFDGAHAQVTSKVTRDFFDAHLLEAPDGLSRLKSDGTVSGVARVESSV